MSVKKFILYFSLLTFITSNFAMAQEGKKTGSIEFTCMLWNGPLTQELYFRDGNKFFPVVPFTNSRSEVHSLKVSKQFSLYIKSNNDDENEDAYHIIGEAALPSETKQVLFILFSNQQEDNLKMRIMAVDDSIKGFPAGSFKFVNFSNSELFVNFGGKVKKIASKKMTMIESNVDKSGGLIPFIIGNRAGKTIYQTRLFSQSNGREMVFISPPEKENGLPSIRFLPQRVSKKSEPPEPASQ